MSQSQSVVLVNVDHLLCGVRHVSQCMKPDSTAVWPMAWTTQELVHISRRLS